MVRLASRVSTRISLLALLPICALAWLGFLVVLEARENLYTQKKNEIRHIVEAAVSIVSEFEKRAAAGEMTREQAQADAKRVIAGLRYGGNEYVFVLDFDHRMVVHPIKPDQVGRDRTWDKDTEGRFFVQEFIAAAKRGGGFVTYGFQKPRSVDFEEKISFVTSYSPWRWVLGSGVLTDDVEAMHRAIIFKLLVSLGIAAIVLAAGASLVAYSITKPLKRLTDSLGRLAKGDVGAAVEGAERLDELGLIACAVADVRQAVSRRIEEQIALERSAELASGKERDRMLAEIAEALNLHVKTISDRIGRAAEELVTTCRVVEDQSEAAREGAGSAAAAGHLTAQQIASVRHATAELDDAIAEISGRAAESSQVAKEAVVQIRKARIIVTNLADASSKIGRVVSMVHEIAEQTNLLALNATIEAARAGDAGRGFAVVASEVKQLAGQTTKATEEISAKIEAVLRATGVAVKAIEDIDCTIRRIEHIAGSIAATVEQQGAGTAQIFQAISHTMTQSETLAESVDSLVRAAGSTNASSKGIVVSACGLSGDAQALQHEVEQFVARVGGGLARYA
jgi:methyl-accepting chemotaxis protein